MEMDKYPEFAKKYYTDLMFKSLIPNFIDTQAEASREFTMFSPTFNVRCIFFYNTNGFIKNFDRWEGYEKPRNIYFSLAHYKKMYMFNFKMKERREQQDNFNKTFKKHWNGYDLGLDFDGHGKDGKDTKNLAYSECKLVKTKLDKYKVPYTLKCSGSGFHIRIDDKYIPQVPDKIVFAKLVAMELVGIYDLQTLDTNIYDARRVWKLDYSLDIKSGNIALPLTDEQFKNFNWDMVKPENCAYDVIGRGLLEREGTKENFKEFCDKFLEVIKNE